MLTYVWRQKTEGDMKFYDRKNELEKLTKYHSLAKTNFFFIRITGRRRIGKTLLIRQYLEHSKQRSLYFFVTKKKEKPLLEEYASIICEQFPEYRGLSFAHFDDFFVFLFALLKRERILVVFDEFQNFKYVDGAIFSILQKHIDLNKQQLNGLLIVIGSINSMMRHVFENSNQPLYGRLSGSFLLGHFSLTTIREILADHGLKGNSQLLLFYSIFQGIPFYYNYLSERNGYGKSLENLLIDDILDENSILLNEGKEILLEEFGKDYSTYFSILEAVATGSTTVSRIADKSGIPVSSLGRYISELMEEHDLLTREVPFDAKDNNKMGRYYLDDNFLDFWFRYIFRNKSRIESLNRKRIALDIMEDLPVYIGKKFEKLMIQHLSEMNRQGRIEFDRIGQYWDRGETEIDIIYTDKKKKTICFGECKLSAKRFKLSALEEKVMRFLKHSGGKYRDWHKSLQLFTPEQENFFHQMNS
jgi:uncharacterized protein